MKGLQNRLQSEEMVTIAKYIKGCQINFGRNDNAGILCATEPERLIARERRDGYRKFYCFGLSLRYKKRV